MLNKKIKLTTKLNLITLFGTNGNKKTKKLSIERLGKKNKEKLNKNKNLKLIWPRRERFGKIARLKEYNLLDLMKMILLGMLKLKYLKEKKLLKLDL